MKTGGETEEEEGRKEKEVGRRETRRRPEGEGGEAERRCPPPG